MSLRCCLAFFGIFDVIFSLVILCCSVIYVAMCKTDDATSFITPSTKVEHWKFFMEALKSCNYEDESNIPQAGVICKRLEREVLPLVITSCALNFLCGVFIQIVVKDKYFLLDDKKGSRTRKHYNFSRLQSIGIIPFGIVLDMLFTMGTILFFSEDKFCWLSYSIEEMSESKTRLVMIIIWSVMLAIYKPTELAIFFFYVSRLIRECNELGERSSATYDLTVQLKDEVDSGNCEDKPETRLRRVTLDEASGIPILKYTTGDEDLIQKPSKGISKHNF